MIPKNAWNKKYNMYNNRIPVKLGKFLIQGKEKTVHDYSCRVSFYRSQN